MALARIGHPCDSTAGCRATRRRHWSTPRSSPSALGVGKVFVKDESSRLGLPAFKVLGASWAVYRALEERLGEGFRGLGGDPGARGASRTHAAALARCGHRRQPRARRGTGGAATGARGEDLRSSGHGPGAPQVHRRRGRRGDRGRWNLRRGRRALGCRRRSERALVVSDMSWPGYERIPLLGDRRLFDDALGDRRRAGEEERRRTRPRCRAGRRRRLRRSRGPTLPQSRGVAAPEAHERRAGERGLSAGVGRCRTHRVRARAARFHHVWSKLRQTLTGRLADSIQLASTSSSPSTTDQHARPCASRPNRASSQERPGRPD